jgi:hypothetical protein
MELGHRKLTKLKFSFGNVVSRRLQLLGKKKKSWVGDDE